MSDGYDVMQVCLNGHVNTDAARRFPEEASPFCDQCGAPTTTTCPDCGIPIQGRYFSSGFGVVVSGTMDAPNNCAQCGTAYPWRQEAIANAIGVLELEMKDADGAEIRKLVLDVARDAPTAQLAVLKIRKSLGHLAKPAYDITIKVVADLISAEVKKKVGL